MVRYYITDRKQAGGIPALLDLIERNASAGVEMIQVREKDLAARELAALVREAANRALRYGTKVLVNERADIAVACGAAGIHLPSNAIAPGRWRRGGLPHGLTIGVSCHDAQELTRAAREGADFAVLAPVFAPLSKPGSSSPLGIERFRELAASVSIPVLALGGITFDNAPAVMAAGAAGIAGITLFQRAPGPSSFAGKQ